MTKYKWFRNAEPKKNMKKKSLKESPQSGMFLANYDAKIDECELLSSDPLEYYPPEYFEHATFSNCVKKYV